MWGSLCREITLVPEWQLCEESVKHSDTDVSAISLARACPYQWGGESDMREEWMSETQLHIHTQKYAAFTELLGCAKPHVDTRVLRLMGHHGYP